MLAMQVQITLTPAESKRLIAKAVALLPEVRRALRSGVVVVGLGTTNAHVAEELLGKKIDRRRFVAGLVLPKGACTLPVEKRLKELVLVRGKPRDVTLDEVLEQLSPGDVVIKGANALDPKGTAGIFLGSRRGGTIGRVLGHLKARGVNLILPIGMEKLVPGPLEEVSKLAGIFRFDDATGCPVGLMPVHGKVVTELEAVRILAGANALVMGAGGVSGAEGSVILLVSGTSQQVRKLMDVLKEIKGTKDPEIETSCENCNHPDCFYSSS
jgi:hypothetical protein